VRIRAGAFSLLKLLQPRSPRFGADQPTLARLQGRQEGQTISLRRIRI
jgi:hypothetical protein